MTVNRSMQKSPGDHGQDNSRAGETEDFLHLDDDAARKSAGGETDRILCRKLKLNAELEADQESTGSSEDMESPRSVAKLGKWTSKNIHLFMHSQILRIREEDSHLGEDIGEGLSGTKDKLAAHRPLPAHVDVVLFSRPILPASPLGGKTDH